LTASLNSGRRGGRGRGEERRGGRRNGRWDEEEKWKGEEEEQELVFMEERKRGRGCF
jgi:hypothetical protein